MDLQIGAILTHAVAFNPRLKMVEGDLRSALHALFDELDQLRIEYLLVGGVALLSFVEGRNTQDIDLIIDPADVGRMPWSASLRDDDFGSATYRSVNVDFLLTTNPFFRYVSSTERSTLTFDGRPVPSVTREGLILLKLYALPSLYRQGKLDRAALYETDILMLHQGVTVDDERLLSVIESYLADSDVHELRKILDEQRQRRRFT
ncbi:MAG TPA: hypothetical protein VGP93_14560 [Polyangiaceae bacterium]|jgi:hypothetical protein|nr:hypothetical protein [Polyangiaceae bacterium]